MPGARRQILAELVGYGATSDGATTWSPLRRRRGALHAQALAGTVRAPVDYINTHGTSTPVGDITELARCARCSATSCPPISLDQVADRPFAGRGRRAGGDLLPADAAGRLHRRLGQHRERSTPRCYPIAEGLPDRARAPRRARWTR
jgi:hypothetical protein